MNCLGSQQMVIKFVQLTLSWEKKPEGAGDPDFVPSVYPKTASKKLGSSEAANVQSIAHYRRAKQRSTAKEIIEQEAREKEVV